MPYKYTKKLAIILTLTFLFLVGCDKKTPEISDQVRLIIGEDLNSWLSKAPFDGKYNLEPADEPYVEWLWPFMGKFKNENGDLNRANDYSYKKEKSIYKNTEWGNSFVYSALFYKQQDIFVEKFYSIP